MDWWRRQPELLRDAVGAVPVVLVFVIAQEGFGAGGSVVRGAAIVVVMGAALTVRRRWPRLAFAAALVVVAAATTGLEFLIIVGYTVVAHDRRANPVVVGLLSLVAMLVGYVQYWPAIVLDQITGDLFLIAAIAVLPPALGRMVRTSRDTTAQLRERNAELVALREQAARHAVEAERFRIARELHDVVAHHVSAMTVRARAGRHVAGRDPEAAEEALAYIARAGTETLDAMGALVGSLRGGEHERGSADLAPQPSLDDLPELLERLRRTGLVVHEDLGAAPTDVPAAIGLSAYRIVQEALTNAIRHGVAERAWVRVWHADGVLHVQVDDDGRGMDDSPRPGHGLVGIAERAALHGGTSTLSPSPRGGCRLEASLGLAQPADRPGTAGGADAPLVMP